MNDFFLATNGTVSVEVLEQQIEVRQIQMKDFGQWLMCAEPIKQAIGDRDHSDEILLEVAAGHIIQAAQLCALVTEFDMEIIFKMMQQSEHEFLKLFAAVIQMNTAYFTYEKPKQTQQKTDDSATWFDSFQYLISMGHRHNDIMNMSYGSFKQYLKSAQKTERQKLAALSNAFRSAQHASNIEYEKFISGLNY